MKTPKLVYFALCCVLITSCDIKCSVGGNESSGTKTKTISSADNNALNGAIIKNDIDIEVTGVKLREAYLVDENNKLLTENITRVGEKIYLVLKLDTGWVKENGKSFLGASERISTAAGKVILNADDIFKEYETTGLDAADSKVLTLSAVLTEVRSGIKDFVVQFRVWDKKGAGEVKGKYKFQIKD